MVDDAEELMVADRAAWYAWLDENHETATSVRLLIPLKDSGHSGPSYPEAVEVALCFGWIDGHMGKSQGDGYRRQRFTPRKPKGNWAASNKERVERMIASGEMRPAGMKEVDAAKADGRWGD